MKKQIAKIFRFSSQKVGGIRFIRIGKFCFSFCVSRNGAEKKAQGKTLKQLTLNF